MTDPFCDVGCMSADGSIPRCPNPRAADSVATKKQIEEVCRGTCGYQASNFPVNTSWGIFLYVTHFQQLYLEIIVYYCNCCIIH